MSSSMLLGLFDWIGDFFKALFNLIPKIIYLLYASLACIIDVLQLFFRKLAGLDVYYVNGEAVSGDLVGNFIRGIFGMYDRSNITYSSLATVFYSMLVFGIIICFASVLIAIIKSHYTYDEKSAKGPMQYVYTGVKSIINMVAVPIIVVMGLYVSNALLNALDTITSVNSGSVVSMFGNGINSFQDVNTVKAATGKNSEKTYLYYDMFGFGGAIVYGEADPVAKAWTTDELKNMALIGSKTQSFSGSLFRVAAYNANRVRLGQYNVNNCVGMSDIFQNAKNQTSEDKQNTMLAEMIDTAFANNMHLKERKKLQNQFDSRKYFTNFNIRFVHAFSKFNIGAVWFFYDLWQFNFIVAFAGIIVCVSIFINIIMGLMVRFFMCITLFLVAPPVFGLAPLDGGSAAKKWRENFMKQALMTYGAVVGMNLMMMILPYLYEIDFFNIPIIDLLAQSLFIIVGLVTIKAVIALMSELIGAADANKTGGDIAKEVGSVAGKAANMTVGAAKMAAKTGGNLTMAGVKMGAAAGKGLTALGGKAAGAIEKAKAKGNEKKAHQLNQQVNKARKDAKAKSDKNQAIIDKASTKTLHDIGTMRQNGLTEEQQIDNLVAGGMHYKDAEALLGATQGLDLSKSKEDIKKQEYNNTRAGARALYQEAKTAKLKSQTQYKRAEAMKTWSGQVVKSAGSSVKSAGSSFFGKDTGKVDEKGRKIRVGGFVGGLKAAPGEIGDIAGKTYGNDFTDAFTQKEKKKAQEQAANIKKSAQSSSRIAAEMEYNRRSAGMSEEEKKKLAKELGLSK